MNAPGLLCVFFFTLLVVVTHGYPNFPNRIPNGNRVPHPCKPNFMWYGVGHQSLKGGGPRNAFGEAFQKYGLEWNVCLCNEDSDGDGKTNGEELGDPYCKWKPGEKPFRTTGLTHPGICEPMSDPTCMEKNKWVDCSTASDFKCDAMKAPDVTNFTIRFPKTKVPPKETTYICKAFNLTSMLPKGESHLIAITASLDNKQVMHHAIVYACEDDTAAEALKTFDTPVECGMGSQLCRNMISLWTVGIDGTCYNDKMGYPLGQNGYKTVLLEFHWNNPDMMTDYTDASGLTLYVKSNRRQYNAGVWSTGPPLVYIPPGFPRYDNNGGCAGACTSLMLTEPIYITRIIPHMHYLGTAFKFQQSRNGQLIYEYVLDKYLYDDPQLVIFDTPLEVRPGDDIKVVCTFQSTDREEFTYYGESTQAEMCFAISMYYPFLNTVSECLMDRGYGFCNNTLYPNPFMESGGSSKCNITNFGEVTTREAGSIFTQCDPSGRTCLPNCKNALAPVLTHPCMTGKARSTVMAYYNYDPEGRKYMKRISSCEPRPLISVGGGNGGGKCDIAVSGAQIVRAFSLQVVAVCLMAIVTAVFY